MHKFPGDIQTVLQAINHCAQQNDAKVFLRGDLVLYALTGSQDFIQEQKIDLVISYDQSFDTDKLYRCLIQHVIVNKEIENSSHCYHFISSGYEIKIDLIHQFDPTRLTQVQRFGSFNLNLLFFDTKTEEIKHPPEVSADPEFLKNIHDKNNWSFEDVLGFTYWKGTVPEISIDKDQDSHLRLLSLGTLKESLDITWEEQVEEILLLRHSGAALSFIVSTFADGAPWTFKILIDYMISMNVGINEESDIETVFNDKKFELIDLYNEFFLGDKKVKETADEIHHRLTTILKLLFDSPNLSIPRPYINRIRAMASGPLGRCCLGNDVGGTIVFFGCGNNADELECAYPIECSPGSSDCLRELPSFALITDAEWDFVSTLHREWCPDQVCPDADNIHCLQEESSSSSSMFQSSSSSQSSSSMSSSSSNSSSSSSSSSQSSSSSSGALCLSCPEFNVDLGTISGTTWNYTSVFTLPAGVRCRMYKCFLADADDFQFSIGNSCAAPSSTSAFDARIEVFEVSDCGPDTPFVTANASGGCTNAESSPPEEANFYIRVSDPLEAGGAFIMGYRRTT